jgi:AMIN domain
MLRLINPGVHRAGAVLALAAAWSVSLAAQSSAPASEQISISAVQRMPNGSVSTASAVARVQHLAVRGTPDAMEIEIVTSGAAVAPDTQAITGPDRIIVDFPGALPSANLRSVQINRGPLKAVRSGLFFNNPPITRIVLDLAGPQSYQISTTQVSPTENKVLIKLNAAKLGADNTISQNSTPAKQGSTKSTLSGQNASKSIDRSGVKLENASLGTNVSAGTLPRVANLATANASSKITASKITAVNAAQTPPLAIPEPAQPQVVVGFENGLLRIHADKATMAEVLFEVQRWTHAEIAIPSGAELERVSVDLGPGSAREVLTALLNGSRYNFIFVGTEMNLERVILTQRDSSIF